MPSAGLSDANPFDEEGEHIQFAIHGSTPRTSIPSPHTYNHEMLDATKHRRSSSVRFTDTKPTLGEDNQSLAGSMMRDGNITPFEEQDRSKMQPQPYVDSLEERMRFLEGKLQSLEFQRASDPSERGEESSGLSGLSTEPQWMTWQEYVGPATKSTSILEVLYEKPHTTNRRKPSVAQLTSAAISKASEKLTPNARRTIERIRIRSPHINTALQTVSKQTFPSLDCLTVHREFKIFIAHKDAIRDRLAEMESNFSQGTTFVLCEQCQQSINLDGMSFEAREGCDAGRSSMRSNDMAKPIHEAREVHAQPSSPQGQPDLPDPHYPSLDEDEGECKHDIFDILVQREAIIHLRAMVSFMENDMREVFAKHRHLRSAEAETVAFHELWHLFQVGDIVVTDDESTPGPPRLYRVSILPVCDIFSSRRPVKEMMLKYDGARKQVRSVYKEESMKVLSIDLISFDYNGDRFGPVETRVSVVHYEGQKKILDLPLYPIRFRKDAARFREEMLARGTKFCRLTRMTYRDYNGLSITEPQEQINSQVMIDPNLAYRKHPEHVPKFGLKSWMEDDARVVTEACGVPGCTDCFKERTMFDDHKIDRQRTVEYIERERSLLRTISNIEELTDDIKLLLPNRVYGFVLRSRKWYFLDIDKITPPQSHSEGFDSLILPEGVKRVVEGLVQTHRPQDVPTMPDDASEQEHHVDLVRGKGKGLIILLHGAPGVGKTSTAECVAEYTHRPLFPITCGDIGETAKEVEHNLDQNFSLAHRWGCVLLLDEADVFLQARDKEDMRRNSVVSVFLRVLEYYSGILFLTTNKIGHFDEAFKSRIHVGLYYPPLDKKSTIKIWKMNLQRLVDNKRYLDVDRDAIVEYAKEHFKRLSKANGSTWNGRQIKNAFQTAIALAEFDAKKHSTKPNLSIGHFEVVAKASEGFDEYLSRVHGGNDADRARRDGQRDDDPLDDRSKRGRFHLAPKSGKKNEETESSSSEESDAKERKRKEKKSKKKVKTKAQESDSDDSTTE